MSSSQGCGLRLNVLFETCLPLSAHVLTRQGRDKAIWLLYFHSLCRCWCNIMFMYYCTPSFPLGGRAAEPQDRSTSQIGPRNIRDVMYVWGDLRLCQLFVMGYAGYATSLTLPQTPHPSLFPHPVLFVSFSMSDPAMLSWRDCSRDCNLELLGMPEMTCTVSSQRTHIRTHKYWCVSLC